MRTACFIFIILAAVLLAFAAGCAPAQPGASPETHMGCQEGEIDANGECVPADANNAGIFGQDLEPHVETAETGLGFLAKPKQPGDYPGVVMIHEWWGLNDNIREMAKILANEGYIVLAVDLYGGEVAEDSAKARELATAVRNNPEQALNTMKSAVSYLRQQENAPAVGSMGWCFGGGQSLQLALNEKLNATVIYYGQLTDDKNQLESISWPVLGIFGEEDTSIAPDSVRGFEAALNELGIENEIYIYPGVGHAFANPSGSNYAMEETIDAWKKTARFLDKSLKAGEGIAAGDGGEIEGADEGYSGEIFAGTTTPFIDFNKADYDRAVSEGKTIVLYFYASWCPICARELPEIHSAFNEMDYPDVVGFRVNYRDSDVDEFEEELARQHGITYQHSKVIIKGGERVLKAPDSWKKERYLEEIGKIA